MPAVEAAQRRKREQPRHHRAPRRLGGPCVVLLCLLATQCRGPTDPSEVEKAPNGPEPYPTSQTFADAEMAGCPTPEQIAAVADVPVAVAGLGAKGPLVCTAAAGSQDLNKYQARAAWALILMKRLRFSQPLPWTSDTLYGWFASVTARVLYESDCTYSHVHPGGHEVHVCVKPLPLGATPMPAPAFALVYSTVGGLIHEARHIEHIVHSCGNDDRTVAEMGAFGVHNLYFQWLGLYSDPNVFPVEWRPNALWTACVQRKSAFCDEPKDVVCQ